MKPNTRILNKFHVAIKISLIMTSIVVIVHFRIAYLKKQQITLLNDFEDDDEDVIMYYEYMGEKVAHEIKKIDDVELLKIKIRKINKEQHIYHQDEYAELLPVTSMIVVQVHDKVPVDFFKTLLYSLNCSIAITKAFLIFSHYYYDDEINTLIGKIRFSKYIQIYYPYSTQLFPDTFPGADPKLCTNDFQCERSVLRYEAFAQKKHFWWWQMNYVFDRLNVTKGYNKAIIFLEADQFVFKDFIVITKIMESLMISNCHKCEILNLGAYASELAQYHVISVNLTKTFWNSHVETAGIAFNRSVWDGIKKYRSLFCHYDDYRWDASLRHLGLKRDRGQFMLLSIDAPRIIKYHKCDDYVECSPERMIDDVTNLAKTVQKALFPRSFHINKAKTRNKLEKKEKQMGGWEDDRDKGLCMYLVKS